MAPPVPGATNDQIVFAQSQFSDTGVYSVVVANAEATVTSGDAALAVKPPNPGDLDYSYAWGGSIIGALLAMALQPDGKVLIAGSFSTVHGAFRGSIARLNADGTTDQTFMNGLSGANYSVVRSVAVRSDGDIIIGGEFTTINGVGRVHIARLNADGTLDSDSEISGADGYVYAIAAQVDGSTLIGGGFTSINGTTRNSIARLDAAGALDSGFQDGLSGLNGAVYSIALQRDGKVLIGGRFTTVNGVSRNNLARLNTDGTLDTTFQNGLAGPDYIIESIAVQSDGKVLIGGLFNTVNGVSRNSIARLNPDGALDSDFQTRLLLGTGVSSIVVQHDGKVLIGGDFNMQNGSSRNGIGRLNGDGTLDSTFQNGLLGASRVFSIAVQNDGKVLIGGAFDSVNVYRFSNLARLNADGTPDRGFQSDVSGFPFPGVSSVAVQSDGKVVIGGEFSAVNGVPMANVARLWGSADIPLQIKTFERTGGEVNLSWYAVSNRTYRVQYEGSSSATNWVDLAGDVSATGVIASKTDATLTDAGQRFYRVVLLP
jgi:uncharacterized delta-60 repeat protein